MLKKILIFFLFNKYYILSQTVRTKEDLSCSLGMAKRVDCKYNSQSECENNNCCWKPEQQSGVPWCFKGKDDTATSYTTTGFFCEIEKDKRVECGYSGIDKEECEDRGCCFKAEEENSVVPWCFKGYFENTYGVEDMVEFEPNYGK